MTELQNNIESNWIVYYVIETYEWNCPICSYLNNTNKKPDNRTLRCLKCGSYFDNVRKA